jgi:hypothetical protein
MKGAKMILIETNPARIQAVTFTGMSAAERNIEAAIYQVIAPLVDRIDRKLRTLNEQILSELALAEHGLRQAPR